MRIEILYPDLGLFYGDIGNILYLSKCLPNAEFIRTTNKMTPSFLESKIDLVYCGSMSEHNQIIAINRLKPYREIIKERIRQGMHFVFTGNTIELLGKYIEDEDGTITECLELYPFYSKRSFSHRLNYLFIGEYDGITIVGNKSQYSTLHGECPFPFIQTEKGLGNNLNDSFEGIHDHNLFATYLLGPFLVHNPLFTERLLKSIDPESELAFRSEAIEAYNCRINDLRREQMQFLISSH